MQGEAAVWALGSMAGTSFDGVEAALILTDGETISGFGADGFRRYTPGERAVIRRAVGCWPGDPGVAEAAEVIETAHAEVLARLVHDAELIGFHGQTLAHDPGGRGTHQAGDGGVLAEVLDRPVIWDFRSSDVELGGQGAPLAPFYHFACAKWIGAEAPVAFLHLGGVASVTWVDPRKPVPEAEGACLAFDAGPGTARIDDLMRARRGIEQDDGGQLAGQGIVDRAVVARFLEQGYFLKMPPKSLDREAFPGLPGDVAGLDDADAAATLAACVAAAVARGAEHFPAPVTQVLVSGGGRHNATLMAMLAADLGCPVAPVEGVGLNGDTLAAQAIGHLAVRVLRGLPTTCPATTGVAACVGGAKISRP